MQSPIIQNHSYNGNSSNNAQSGKQDPNHLKQIYLSDPTAIEKLLLGNEKPPDPAALNLPSWEPTKCSVRENGLIMGYAANTN
jgi:hypothetical protein